ncbi:MAG: hypothetical protein LBB41_03415 [Prevotellaceae bacterium]|jgi:hypothetical protein|nr:hypothetical protein [Prevotellaceae bacterium]
MKNKKVLLTVILTFSLIFANAQTLTSFVQAGIEEGSYLPVAGLSIRRNF